MAFISLQYSRTSSTEGGVKRLRAKLFFEDGSFVDGSFVDGYLLGSSLPRGYEVKFIP